MTVCTIFQSQNLFEHITEKSASKLLIYRGLRLVLYWGAVLRFPLWSKQSPWYTGGGWAGCLRRLGRRWRLSPSGQWLPPSTLMRAEAYCGLEKPRPPQGKCQL